jgi:xanthine dehydrogenase YagR molybdenum-binding subunit
MPDYSWPPMDKRAVIGTRATRVDAAAKLTGKAKYPVDAKPPEMLHAALLTCPHAHARVAKIEMAQAAEALGVKAVEIVSPPGTEILWAGTEVAAVAAETAGQAADAVRKIRVEYEVLPHVVHEEDLAKAGSRAKAAGSRARAMWTRLFVKPMWFRKAGTGFP